MGLRLFGGNYDKPGKGISKDEPQKRGLIRFFEIYFRFFWRLSITNLWWFIISLPVLTVGLSNVGLALVTRNTAIETHTFGTSDFFETIKKNWKKALASGIINLVACVILAYDLYFFYLQLLHGGLLQTVLFAIAVFVSLIFAFMRFYIPLMIITFELPLGKIYRNSLILAFAGLKRNFCILLGMILLYALLFGIFALTGYAYLIAAIYFLLYMFVLPAFRSYLIQYNVFPVIKKHMIDPYYEQNPDADIEIRRSMGLLKDDPSSEDDTVFSDDTRKN